MTEKLTPRVGDRVLVQKGWGYHTMVGQVVERVAADDARPTVREDTDHFWKVNIDGYGETLVHPEYLTVVDRDPVEWPEGWGKHSKREAGLYLEANGWYFTRCELELILATGPDMLSRWDELMGDES